MALVAVIEDVTVAQRILGYLGLATRAPPRGLAWRRQASLPGIAPAGDWDGVDPPAFAD